MKFAGLFSKARDIAARSHIPRLTQGEVRFVRRILGEMVSNSQDQILFIEGDRGSGKSLAALRLSQAIGICLTALGEWSDPTDRFFLTFDSRDFARQIGNYAALRMFDIRMYEEPQTGEASAYRQQTLEGQLISSGVQAWRHKQQIVIVTAASGSKLNKGLRDMKTYLIVPPSKKWRRYVLRGYTAGRGRNINRRERKSAWDLKACHFSSSLNKSICEWIRDKERTGKTRRRQFLYFRHPGKAWEDDYEDRKPRELGLIFRRRFGELPWVTAENEARETRQLEDEISP